MFAPIFLGDVQPQFFMRQTLFLIYLLVFYGTNSVFNIFFSFFLYRGVLQKVKCRYKNINFGCI